MAAASDSQTDQDQKFGYEQTLLYGQYTRELGTFAKFQAKRLKLAERQQRGVSQFLEKKPRLRKCLGALTRCRDVVLHTVGEDWVFLAVLGIIMALLSFGMDYVIEKCQEAKIWLYDELSFSVPLQFFAWISYTIVFILFATGFTHIVSPQAIGSGIPEMKTILRGVVLKEYLTFRTLVAKIVGLCSSLGSTLPIGKEGPFVHVASIVATLLSKFFTSFRGIYENESRKSEMLAAACAVGVACTFAAPIGGVLFSIEVTATYFAVRNYWRGFFAAVCGATVFRLLALWFKDEETITALLRTSLRTDFPFDACELFAFGCIGVVCGFAGPLFILLHRNIIIFTRRRRTMSSFLQKNRFIYPSIVAILISSLTFPPGLGQFFAGQLTHRQAINELFSNFTWTTGQADDLQDEQIINHWTHSSTNVYVNLVLFILMNFWMGALSNTLPVPAGVFVPVFSVGAAFGRLVGEAMAAWFPLGINTGNVVRQIVPGGYAVVGAAALSGSVTRTISTSVIVFELTGQISHVLPAVIAVLIANAVAHRLQPSFYDSIIRLKRLPYLPDIVSAKSRAWNVCVDDIMVKELKFVSLMSVYEELQDLMIHTYFRTYPLVDSPESMILLGSIQRFELERLLVTHLNPEQRICLADLYDSDSDKHNTSYGSGGFEVSGQPLASVIPQTPHYRPDGKLTTQIANRKLSGLEKIVDEAYTNSDKSPVIVTPPRHISPLRLTMDPPSPTKHTPTSPTSSLKKGRFTVSSPKAMEAQPTTTAESQPPLASTPQTTTAQPTVASPTVQKGRFSVTSAEQSPASRPRSLSPKRRFTVTKVNEETGQEEPADEPGFEEVKYTHLSPEDPGSTCSSAEGTWTNAYKLKSILKKASTDSLIGMNSENEELDTYYRNLASSRKSSLLEDFPYFIQQNETASETSCSSKHVQLPPEMVKVKSLTAEEQVLWERKQLQKKIIFEGCQIDPAPFQLVERTSLHKTHSLFSLLGLNHAYVTNTGRIVGVVALKELRNAIQGHIDEQAKGGSKVQVDEDPDLDDPAELDIVIPEFGDKTKLEKNESKNRFATH